MRRRWLLGPARATRESWTLGGRPDPNGRDCSWAHSPGLNRDRSGAIGCRSKGILDDVAERLSSGIFAEALDFDRRAADLGRRYAATHIRCRYDREREVVIRIGVIGDDVDVHRVAGKDH